MGKLSEAGQNPLHIFTLLKLKRMTKREIRNAINKQVYQFAESLGYQISDDGDGSTVTFMRSEAQTIDDSIDWSRSYHETCVLNWASDQTKADAHQIDEFAKRVIEQVGHSSSVGSPG